MGEDKSDKIEEFRKRFGNSLPQRKDQAAMERRRQHVWEMALQGIPQTVMADILHVTRQTISSDLDYLEKLEQKKTQLIKKDPNYAELDIGVTCRKLQSIAEEAMAQASICEDPQDKDRWLNTAQRALMNYAKVRIETGIWPKAGVEVKGEVQHQVSFSDKFGTDSKYKLLDNSATRRRVMAVVEGIIKEASNEAQAIPVEAKVIDVQPVPPPAPEKPPA